MRKQFITIALVVLLELLQAFSALAGVPLGPLIFSNHEETGGYWLEAAGPFVRYYREGDIKGFALHPLAVARTDRALETAEFDLLYPVLTWNRFGAEYRLQLLQVLSLSGGRNNKDDAVRRVTFFPFFFHQWASDPDLCYVAVMPFYGRLKNRLFRDDIHVVLFPVYVKTRKRDITTSNFFLPFFHLREGEKLKGWQLWPLVGIEKKFVTTVTNSFGEATIVGGHDKRMLLWPFGFSHKTGLGTSNESSHIALLPFFSIQRSPVRKSMTMPWPLGLTLTNDKEKQYREWGVPWPFVVFARGEGKTANRIWPLFGQARNPSHQSDFYVWPVYKLNRLTTADLDRQRVRILFFLYSDTLEQNKKTGTASQRTDLWPLFTATRDHESKERLQILAILEPFLPQSEGVRRTYSSIWSVWRSEHDPQKQTRTKSLLWNLYRFDENKTGSKCSFLFGLVQCQTGPSGRRWRVLYLPFPKQGEASNHP